MKTFYRYLSTICATTFSGVFFLRIFHYGFIYEKPSEIILGCVPTLGITVALILICSFFQLSCQIFLITAIEKKLYIFVFVRN